MGGGSGGVRIGRVGDGGRQVDSEAFRCPRAFDLASVSEKDGVYGLGMIHPTAA